MIYLGDRVLHPRRQQTARRYTLFDWTAHYRYKALDAQSFFASRLQGAPAEGVPDIHFVPENPRTFLGGRTLRF